LIWFVLVGLPLRIVSFTLVLVVSGSIMSLLWLLLADDHGAAAMGAALPRYGFNQADIV
jgi:hypothetical protein